MQVNGEEVGLRLNLLSFLLTSELTAASRSNAWLAACCIGPKTLHSKSGAIELLELENMLTCITCAENRLLLLTSMILEVKLEIAECSQQRPEAHTCLAKKIEILKAQSMKFRTDDLLPARLLSPSGISWILKLACAVALAYFATHSAVHIQDSCTSEGMSTRLSKAFKSCVHEH